MAVAAAADMATGDTSGALGTWLNKATDPENPADRWDCIQRFYELVNREPEGPQTAVRLLAHKIQSPQEKEALQAITLLEACMNYCGKKFHNEAGKFRFLNELIKVLSPKYLGAYSAEVVKQKVAEMLYSWTQWLKDEPKIQEAYTMLKKQGIIKKDPKLPEEIFMPPPSQRVEVSVFDDEDKSKLLARLLKSTNPEDLQTANRFIKNTIKEEQEKVERESRRVNTLEEVEKNATQLRGLLERHRGSGAHAQPTDGMKTLYERCDKLRPNLFRLASETVDNDEALAQILQANDQLTSVITIYKEMSEKPGVNGRRSSDEEPPSPVRSYHLIDFSTLDTKPGNTTSSSADVESNDSLLLMDKELAAAGFSESAMDQATVGPFKSYCNELLELQDIVQVRKQRTKNGGVEQWSPGGGLLLTSLCCGTDEKSQNYSADPFTSAPGSPSKLSSLTPVSSLATLSVSLDSIRPSPLEPITVYDRWGIHVSLHFCCDSPQSPPGVAVFVTSAVNTSALPVLDVVFQAAVPKSMTVKLQPATGKDLPPYNPILPPASISQIMLLANPVRAPVRLRYKLMFMHGDQKISELGEIDHFPEWGSWSRS
ncbi:ADP-ribosylation factor-binding protein GGA3-like [Denticeps clupeoides]|uniref:ADP-ribosylation factor-binding protein GGA3-like n=1 Tax=Denticeps clupeoides TaxID=299321 RepID=UPI0010A56DD7|nr:ADP-ribosylation factor-binding protein GGA3-like [Denticeps clupeoides]